MTRLNDAKQSIRTFRVMHYRGDREVGNVETKPIGIGTAVRAGVWHSAK